MSETEEGGKLNDRLGVGLPKRVFELGSLTTKKSGVLFDEFECVRSLFLQVLLGEFGGDERREGNSSIAKLIDEGLQFGFRKVLLERKLSELSDGVRQGFGRDMGRDVVLNFLERGAYGNRDSSEQGIIVGDDLLSCGAEASAETFAYLGLAIIRFGAAQFESEAFVNAGGLANRLSAARVVGGIRGNRIGGLLAVVDIEAKFSRLVRGLEAIGGTRGVAGLSNGSGVGGRGGFVGTWITAVVSIAKLQHQLADHFVDIESLRARHDNVVSAAVECIAGINNHQAARAWIAGDLETADGAVAEEVSIVEAVFSGDVIGEGLQIVFGQELAGEK
jgi:hypothetical protein